MADEKAVEKKPSIEVERKKLDQLKAELAKKQDEVNAQVKVVSSLIVSQKSAPLSACVEGFKKSIKASPSKGKK